ncbi:ABC transporter ATP-binding protein [Halolamina sediminis]|uniref:ABC transporter ATP-binding protein n=1 Tax=Halolamina sediminis TaxID=1480675 RepID=UPI0009AE5402|nr:ABC transporter ATP-binding protein [Halolamina sediminis]
MHAIATTDLTKRYGDVTALDGVSLSIEAGTTFGLLGTNGAGKSTLFKLLVGHLTPDSGTVTVGGTDVTDAGHRLRDVVGYVPEHAGFPDALTGREVLGYHARLRGVPKAERADRVAAALGTVGLDDAADRRVGGYSNGMNRRLALASALLDRPRLLLLDEPTAGLDPLGVAEFHRILDRLREESDLTVVLTTHVLAEVEALCDDAAVLHDGDLLFDGAVGELRELGEGDELEAGFGALIADAGGSREETVSGAEREQPAPATGDAESGQPASAEVER